MAMVVENSCGDGAEQAADVFGPSHVDHMIR